MALDGGLELEEGDAMTIDDIRRRNNCRPPWYSDREAITHIDFLLARIDALTAALEASRPQEHEGNIGLKESGPFRFGCSPNCPGCESERLRREALKRETTSG